MADSGVWKDGKYRPVENEDADSFHLLVSKTFTRVDVANTMENFTQMVLTVGDPMNLLRVVSQVFIRLGWA